MLPVAQQHWEEALQIANEIGSIFHAGITRGHLIALYILQNELIKAENALKGMLYPELPMQTLIERFLWQGRAELALAQGDFDLALQIIDRLVITAANAANRDISAIPYMALLRGKALTALQQWSEAEITLLAALKSVQDQSLPRLIWRINVALGKLYQIQSRHSEAVQTFAAACKVIDEIAAIVPDTELRNNFVHQANAMMSQPQPGSPLSATKQTHHGLTRREREVAVLIAQGKSNRAIAETLVIGERTVEGYVSNMLNKLGFTSRAQIAAWVIEKGL